MADHKRRSTDGLNDDIEEMIISESDPKQRAFLIVLNSINKSLIANTDTIRDVSNKLETHLQHFEEHTRAEEALMNRGRGAWWIASWVIGVVQVVGLGIWTIASNDIRDINNSLRTLELRLTVVEKSSEQRK
jgi:hypothetical protein